METPAPLVVSRLVRLPEVLILTGFRSPDSIYRMCKAGTFPKPRKLGARASAWRLDEITTWIASRPVAAALHE